MDNAEAATAAASDALRSLLEQCGTPVPTAAASFPGLGPVSTMDILASRASLAARHDDISVDRWLQERLRRSLLNSLPRKLSDLDHWRVDEKSGNIVHETGRFFKIKGLKVRHCTPEGEVSWDQPIIDQPEFGILGILACFFDGVLHFCLRAKEEPGNINGIQLAPTVQATYSNYTQKHGGAAPPLLDRFLDPPRDRIILSKLQSEDGSRFLFKSNRNRVILAREHELGQLPDDCIWLTLRQISGLLQRDNVVNACSRSVLSCLLAAAVPEYPAIPASPAARLAEPTERFDPAVFGAGLEQLAGAAGPDAMLASLGGLSQWLDDQRTDNHILQKRISLGMLEDWKMDQRGFFTHRENRFFTIVGIRVSSPDREVRSWDQPILVNAGTGIIGLLLRRLNGRFEGLFQAKAEVGNRAIVQVAPTVQFTPGNYQDNVLLKKPFLYHEFLRPRRFPVLHESRQSEEGGRFYREDHVHRVLLLPDGTDLDLPPAYRWLSQEQIRILLHLGDNMNSCSRSILACIL